MTDRAHLRALAAAATPGPWHTQAWIRGGGIQCLHPLGHEGPHLHGLDEVTPAERALLVEVLTATLSRELGGRWRYRQINLADHSFEARLIPGDAFERVGARRREVRRNVELPRIRSLIRLLRWARREAGR